MDITYVVILLVFVLLEVIMVKLGGWLLPAVTAIFGLGIVAASIPFGTDIPFYPFPNLFLAVVSVVVLVHSAGLRVNE